MRRSTPRRLRRRAVPGRVRQRARLQPIADAAHKAGALLIVVDDRDRRARRAEVAGRDGRRYRCGRGPIDRQRLEFRRALCRAVCDARQVRAPDAGPPVRRDGRCRGPARLRADAVDARAAHPPREGDEQHLHQLRPVRAGVHHPHDAARRERAEAAGGDQSCQRLRSRRSAGQGERRRGGHAARSSTSSRSA